MMQKFFFVFITSILISGCTLINRDSAEHYELRKKLRHGFVPIPADTVKKAKAPIRVDQQVAQRGKKLFRTHCVNCHGVNADGNGAMGKEMSPPPKDLVKIAKSVPNFKFYMMVSQWEGGMPGWRSLLSDRDIKDIEQYIYSLTVK